MGLLTKRTFKWLILVGSFVVTIVVTIFASTLSSVKAQATLRVTNVSFEDASSARDTGNEEGYELMNSSDCYTCHADYKIVLAPAFSEIASRYKNDKTAIPKLVGKVISGSVGIWGDRTMPAHPELLREDVQKMIQYILKLNTKKDSTKCFIQETESSH